MLTRTEAEGISQQLHMAIELDASCAHYYYLWALVKHDFYATHGFRIDSPDIEELVGHAESLPPDGPAIREMLECLPTMDEDPLVIHISTRRA